MFCYRSGEWPRLTLISLWKIYVTIPLWVVHIWSLCLLWRLRTIEWSGRVRLALKPCRMSWRRLASAWLHVIAGLVKEGLLVMRKRLDKLL
jgi:hypothetical protein